MVLHSLALGHKALKLTPAGADRVYQIAAVTNAMINPKIITPSSVA